MSSSKLGIVVNPMSGRDVRRVAAKASTSSHHEKQQQVTRLVLGALAQGVEQIFLADEPFRINARAVENLPQRNQITLLKFPLQHNAQDTETMVHAMWEAGCRVFIVLGGDGTNRIIAKCYPDATILPLSTGTNNVFPTFVEASVAGAAAGLIASGKLNPQTHCLRCKQIHISSEAYDDELAMIDAILLHNDSLGSLLPFSADNIQDIILTRAEPASVGISPIGGYLLPSHHEDDFGVAIRCGEPGKSITVPISPGLYNDISIGRIARLDLGESVTISGPGILAFDGDRTMELKETEQALLTVKRDGPWIIDTANIMNIAAGLGLFSSG